MTFLKEWWRWFARQSWLNKLVIVGFSAALVLFLVPLVVSWFKWKDEGATAFHFHVTTLLAIARYWRKICLSTDIAYRSHLSYDAI